MASGTIHTETYTAQLSGTNPDTWLVYGNHFDTIGVVRKEHPGYCAYRHGKMEACFASLEAACEDLVKIDNRSPAR